MTLSRTHFFNAKFPQTTTFAARRKLPVAAAERPLCTLRWRQDRLWVTHATDNPDQIPLPALASEEWFRSCLTRSRAESVVIEPALGKAAICLWARACEEAGKPLYLRVPSLGEQPQRRNPLLWWVKGSCDRIFAALLLALLSPLMLLIAALIRLQDDGPIFYTQWRVGARGRLFKIYKYRSMVPHAEQLHDVVMGNQPGLNKLNSDPRVTFVGQFLRKFSLDELPQLINVLRGEMSLVGPRPWAIYDAVRIPSHLRGRLKAMPGITGPWQIAGRSHELDLSIVTRQDLDYLQRWSLLHDLIILLKTAPKVLFGEGAY